MTIEILTRMFAANHIGTGQNEQFIPNDHWTVTVFCFDHAGQAPLAWSYALTVSNLPTWSSYPPETTTIPWKNRVGCMQPVLVSYVSYILPRVAVASKHFARVHGHSRCIVAYKTALSNAVDIAHEHTSKYVLERHLHSPKPQWPKSISFTYK